MPGMVIRLAHDDVKDAYVDRSGTAETPVGPQGFDVYLAHNKHTTVKIEFADERDAEALARLVLDRLGVDVPAASPTAPPRTPEGPAVPGYDNIKKIHYRNVYGRLLWEEPMVFSSLQGAGEDIVKNYIRYRVKRVAVVDDVQHVNLDTEATEVRR
jgi:hypothetical protein